MVGLFSGPKMVLVFLAVLCFRGITAFSTVGHSVGITKLAVELGPLSATADAKTAISNSRIPSLASIGTVTFLIPHSDADQLKTTKFGKAAPVENPSVLEAAQQLAKKCEWFADGLLDTNIVPIPSANDNDSSFIKEELLGTNVLIALGLTQDDDLKFCSSLFQDRLTQSNLDLKNSQCQFALDCAGAISAEDLPSFVGPYNVASPVSDLKAKLFPWTGVGSGFRLAEQMTSLFQKWSSDEFVFAILIFLNQFSGSEVDWVKHSIDATWEKGPIRNAQELYAMVSQCGDCIGECVKDDNCRECLDKLTENDTRDQVASYRTIVSYESELLRDFSFCILQKNNIFNCDATIPSLPKVKPLTSFRGQPMTEELARSLLVGHLDDEAAPSGAMKVDTSWIVALGGNEAYDKFPSQNQLFYPAARGRDMWYDPVFRVETLDGRCVWCKRHYKVRPQHVPGTFRFSVLDNGITSDEFWTIIDVADDLSWIVFHYAGAASAVGQRYLGGLVCVPPGGTLPDASELPRVWDAVRSAGMEPWELYCVDNDTTTPAYVGAGAPPLDFFRKEVMEKRAAAAAAK